MSGTAAEDIYQAAIMDRARRPRHQGQLTEFDVEVEETNPLCGDKVTLTLRRNPEGEISAVGYHARACAICVAATDLMAEIVPGMTAETARSTAAAFEAKLRRGAPEPLDGSMTPLRPFQPLRDVPSRISCATLGWTALVKALSMA